MSAMLIQILVVAFFTLPIFFLIINKSKSKSKSKSKKSSSSSIIPKCYPIIGSYFAVKANRKNSVEWMTKILQNSPSSTFTVYYFFGLCHTLTANPDNVKHMLKTHFHNYPKGSTFFTALYDFLGNGIFNADGDSWKFQRQVSSHEFNTKSLRKFVQTVVDTELHDRLIPIFSGHKTVLDLQEILQRFAFDNICRISFGFDPACLLPSSPEADFLQAFEDATNICRDRLLAIFPIVWKIKRLFNIGSEKKLNIAVSRIRDFAKMIVKEKKQELANKSNLESVDLLSRFLNLGHTDENFVVDIIISFILAGRDTTSAALTWFFWLISKHPQVEEEILKEIKETSNMLVFEEVKDMVYTHASLCESMRLYPPVPVDTKWALHDDIFPDGTLVKKGTPISYHPYAMGRMENIWGSDWAEFKPERWLVRDESGKWSFVGIDAYSYPIFQAGPRICLGREMAFLQMKTVVSTVLRRFKVVPALEDSFQPKLVYYLTSKMVGGFPVRIEERKELVG